MSIFALSDSSAVLLLLPNKSLFPVLGAQLPYLSHFQTALHCIYHICMLMLFYSKNRVYIKSILIAIQILSASALEEEEEEEEARAGLNGHLCLSGTASSVALCLSQTTKILSSQALSLMLPFCFFTFPPLPSPLTFFLQFQIPSSFICR
ncbi:hypothetical protein GQ457_09G010350 [Hibiscus cannabinus]